MNTGSACFSKNGRLSKNDATALRCCSTTVSWLGTVGGTGPNATYVRDNTTATLVLVDVDVGGAVVVPGPGGAVVVVGGLGVSTVTVLGPVGLFVSQATSSAMSTRPTKTGLCI